MKKNRDGRIPIPGIRFRKFLSAMKWSCIFILAGCMHLSAAVFPQQEKISISLQDVSIEELIKTIKSKTQADFLYSVGGVELNGRVSVNLRHATIEEILQQAFQEKNLTYTLNNGVYIIRSIPRPPQDTIKLYTLKGQVTDEKGSPLAGVTIRLEGTNIGVATDREGNFSIRLPREKGILIFSFVGFQSVRMPYIFGTPVKLTMSENTTQLDEVHAIGYGTRTRREETGAVSSVKARDLENLPSASVSNLLQGRVAGMRVVNESGDPGGAPKIVIRGLNSMSMETGARGSDPLWVIDGVPVFSNTSRVTGQNAIAAINPADIESIDVLKDAAAAAIYGSEAANGVILVTTKKGKLNEKTRVSVSVSQSVSFNPPLPDQLSADDERRVRLEALSNFQEPYYDYNTGTYKYPESYKEAFDNYVAYDYWSKPYAPTIDLLQDSLNPYCLGNTTDWFDLYFRTARVTDANVQFTGGTDKTAYSIGLGYYNESGVLRHSGFNRVSLMSNLYFKPFRKLEGNLRIYAARTGKKRAHSTNSSYAASDEIARIPSELMKLSRMLPDTEKVRQAVMKSFEDRKEKNNAFRLRGAFDLGYEFIRGLKLKSSFAVDYSQNHVNTFLPSDLNEYDESCTSRQITSDMTWLNENLLSFTRSINGVHNIDFLAGLSFQGNIADMTRGFAYGSPSNSIIYSTWNGNERDTENNRPRKEFNTDHEENTKVSIFSRLSYNYNRKYLASVTARWDASSKFGKDVRWGFFPSYSLAYIISEEDFMDWSESFLDLLKIRVSNGKSGHTFNNNYLAQGAILTGDFTYQGHQTLEPDWIQGLINPRLTWEETDQWDAGIELELFKYRLGITIDYYRRNTKKLLCQMNLPGNFHGFTSMWGNYFGVRNEGIEIELRTDLIRTENTQLNLTVNFAHNWNKLVKSINDLDFINSFYPNNISVLNRPLNGIYAYKDNGFYTSQDEVPYSYNASGLKQYLGAWNEYFRPGDRNIQDVSMNGSIGDDPLSDDDRVYCGSPLPVGQGGIITTFKWKRLDFSAVFNFTIGQHILNAAQAVSVGTIASQNPEEITTPIFGKLSDIRFYGKDANPNFPVNRAYAGLPNYSPFLSSNVEYVHYLTGKTFTIGYTLPVKKGQSEVASLHFYVSGENLFCLTNYTGRNPELVNIIDGIDYGDTVPTATKMTLGVSLKF